jgi:beta-galactosidase
MKCRLLFYVLFFIAGATHAQLLGTTTGPRSRINFNKDWRFRLGEAESPNASQLWRTIDLPHDWSIEGTFTESNPAGVGGGALPGGIGWYKKIFTLPAADKGKIIWIEFDGVYRNSEVSINGQVLGTRPNGYISFRYDLTPYLKFNNEANILTVKVDNSKQPNSRWYSGSGIYRNVWLTKLDPVHVSLWGTYVTTSQVTNNSAKINITTQVENRGDKNRTITLTTILADSKGKEITRTAKDQQLVAGVRISIEQQLDLVSPTLWSLDNPALYKIISKVTSAEKVADVYETTFGVRYFEFHVEKGFLLNGQHVKINGVCNHHDLGALGSAINKRALERQLEILKGMGVNAIRTSHNPPAPELLELCDKMGFIVMDEMFDMWKKKKSEFDYSMYWDQWHKRDLEDFIMRDRNHPSVIIWSIGNEILEQWDSTGTTIAKELAGIVRDLDNTRPITTANNDPKPHNNIIKSGALDLIGYNYNQRDYASFPERFPNQKFIATETTSALATRGHYDMPSDSIRRWPIAWDKPFTQGNPDNTVSAYDNVSAPWGSTHEETLKVMKKYDFLSGMFIWTGFDYLGEPTPYGWPSRSSYFGVVDIAGFPKDSYYLYRSEWTNSPVLHIFPHWNWKEGQAVDVWAYYNQADEVELFLNDKSMGVKRKEGDDLHVMWRLNFAPGTLRAVSRKNGQEVLRREIKTAGAPSRIILEADRTKLKAGGDDLSFVTVKILDGEGNVVPDANNLVKFTLQGEGVLAGVDNGDPVSHDPFNADQRKVFNGLSLVIIRTKEKKGNITIKASSEGLAAASLNLVSQ